MKSRRANLTEGPIASTIFRMAGGMLFGFIAMSAFNAADTYFVGQLGGTELAAMSFTFPVVMILNSVSMGLGVGLSSTVSRAIGAGDHQKVQRLASDGLALAVMVVVIIGAAGLFTIRPLFSLLGAEGTTLDLIHDYMFVWYIGVPFVVIPMAGNNVIRATGDTLTPSMIMIASVAVNIILDPLLIFGIGPFPSLGIRGAAIATVTARFTTLLFSLFILGAREKVLTREWPGWRTVTTNWKAIAYVGLPAAIVQAINPISLGVITRLLSQFGDRVVAGFGAATRVEMLVMIVPMALAAVMAPFAGQNWGAGNIERIRKAVRISSLSSVIWGVAAFIIFLFTGRHITGLFNDNPEIVRAGTDYLRTVSISYGFMGMMIIASQSFSAVNRPLHSGGITLLKAFILNIPLALLGAFFWQETGIFFAILVTNLLAGTFGFIFLSGS